jgi:hypothetical protein
MISRQLTRALVFGTLVALSATSIVLADNVQNDVVAGGNDTITAGGSTTVNYRITANNGDGQTGCNAADLSPATVTINAPSNVSATPDSLTFASCGTDQSVVFSSSVVGDHEITASVSDTGSGTYNTNPAKFTLHVNSPTPTPTPTNTAPSVAFDADQPGAAVEGDTKTFTFTITDPDAGDVFGFTADPDCGSGNTLEPGFSITGNTGSFACAFPDGVVPAVDSTVSVQVSDGEDNSNVATHDVTVTNADPVVAVPTWSYSSINCGDQATLTGISFSDAGVNDNPWSLGIDWDDGSTDYSDANVAAQGAYGNQSHTYDDPGTYNATVTVTDKDTGTGSNTSGNLTVAQTYTATFYRPLDVGGILNSFKNGRVIPVKVSLTDDCNGDAAVTGTTGETVTVRLNTVALTGGSTGTDAVEEYADAGASSGNTDVMRWSEADGFWIYNLDSKALGLKTGSTYRLKIEVDATPATQSALLTPTK